MSNNGKGHGLPIGYVAKSASGARKARSTAGKHLKYGVRTRSSKIFVGTSVEGGTEQFVKVVSGKVSDKKPSFAR